MGRRKKPRVYTEQELKRIRLLILAVVVFFMGSFTLGAMFCYNKMKLDICRSLKVGGAYRIGDSVIVGGVIDSLEHDLSEHLIGK